MKAIVLETRGREAAVLVRDGTVRVARGSYHVGDTFEYIEAPRSRLSVWKAVAAAVVVAIGLAGGLWLDRNYITYAEVSLDVNPSIVFSVNKRDRILSVRAVNEDAEGIVKQLREGGIRFMALSEAVEKTMEVLDGAGYLSEETEDYVLINVSADDETRQSRLVDAVEVAMTQTMARDSTLEYHVDRSDRDTARQARESSMSTGRYAAWQQAGKAEGDSGEPAKEDYATKPVREMIGQDGSAQDDPGLKGQVSDVLHPSDHAAEGQVPDSSTSDKTIPERDESAPESGMAVPGSGVESAAPADAAQDPERSTDTRQPSGKNDNGEDKKPSGPGGAASGNASGGRKSGSAGGKSKGSPGRRF